MSSSRCLPLPIPLPLRLLWPPFASRHRNALTDDWVLPEIQNFHEEFLSKQIIILNLCSELTFSNFRWFFWCVSKDMILTPGVWPMVRRRIGACSRLFSEINALTLLIQRMKIDPYLRKWCTRSDCFQLSGKWMWKTWSRFGSAATVWKIGKQCH